MFLKVSNLSFSYINNTKQDSNANKLNLINNISFTFCGPGLHIIYGHNGAGKTSLLKLISGLLTPLSGEVKINDVNINKNTIFPFLTNTLLLSPTTFDSNLSLKNILKYFNIKTDFVILNKLDLDVNNLYPNLSEGEKDKFRIYCALSSRGIVIIDEPFRSLDTKAQKLISDILLDLSKYKLLIITSPKRNDLFNNAKTIFKLNKRIK